jgi:hypothetical protein
LANIDSSGLVARVVKRPFRKDLRLQHVENLDIIAQIDSNWLHMSSLLDLVVRRSKEVSRAERKYRKPSYQVTDTCHLRTA